MKSQSTPTFQRTDLWIAVLLLAIVIISKAPTLSLPYHWDEGGAYMGPTIWLYQNGLARVLPGHHPTGTFFGHPPALYVSLVLWSHVFGLSLWTSHLFILVFAYLGIYYTYLIGRSVSSRFVGLIAALFLYAMPVYFVQSGLVLGDLPLAALTVMSVYYVLCGNYRAYLLCSIYMVLLKETALTVVVAILLYVLWSKRHQHKASSILLRYSIPIWFLAGFFLWQRLATGSWMANPYFEQHALIAGSVSAIPEKSLRVLSWIAIQQNRYLLTLLCLGYCFRQGRKAWRPEYLLFALVGLFFWLAFSVMFSMYRYLLPVLPFFSLWAADSLNSVFTAWQGRALVSYIIIGAFVFAMPGKSRTYGNCDFNLQYLEMIALHRRMCGYLQSNYADARMVSIWPITDILQIPRLGYVATPMRVVPVGQEYDVLLYVDKQTEENAKLRMKIQGENLPVKHRFALHNKYIDLFENQRRKPKLDIR